MINSIVELELVDVYRYEGYVGKRFRFRIRGSRIYINVLATSIEEAVEKVKNMIKQLELDKNLALSPDDTGRH